MRIIFVSALFAATMLAQFKGAVNVTQEKGDVRVLTEEVVGAGTPGARVETKRFVFSNGQGIDLISGVNVGPTVTKAPYAAEAVTEFIQTLYDGNRIVQRSSTKQYRDSEGRERREEGDVVFITDPVAKLSLTLNPSNKTAEKFSRSAEIEMDKVKMAMVHMTSSGVESRMAGTAEKATFNFEIGGKLIAGPVEGDKSKEEDLGTRMIEGVEAKGTRTTETIAAGTIGNDRAIEIVDERWYSPELQLTVLTRHIDPRSGENTYKLVNIQRIEQIRSLFEIPSNYTVHEAGKFGKVFKEEE